MESTVTGPLQAMPQSPRIVSGLGAASRRASVFALRYAGCLFELLDETVLPLRKQSRQIDASLTEYALEILLESSERSAPSIRCSLSCLAGLGDDVSDIEGLEIVEGNAETLKRPYELFISGNRLTDEARALPQDVEKLLEWNIDALGDVAKLV